MSETGRLAVAGRSFSVVGAGRSGLAAANVLASRGGDVLLLEAKGDAVRPDTLDQRVAFRAGTNDVRPGDVAVLSPGISEVSPTRARIASRASEIMGELELGYRLLPPSVSVLAVTGTDGKSTVTTMLGDIIALAGYPTIVGGNLGNPLCGELDRIGPDHVVVVEVSCFQLTTCSLFHPRLAVVTNIAPDHIDYHGSFEAYQAAKQLVWGRMGSNDVLVINGDDPHIASWKLPTEPGLRRFSLASEDADARVASDPSGTRLEVRAPTALSERLYIMMRDELGLLGEHNTRNALAAAQMAVDFGIEPSVVRRALMAYRALPHRLSVLGTFGGLTWINDSKATSPNAAAAGLKAIETPVVMMLGGSSKDTDFAELAALVRRRTRAAVCFGDTREVIARALGDHPKAIVETLPEAIEAARHCAHDGDTILFSPACASFDQFRSYAHRGETFTTLVTSGN